MANLTPQKAEFVDAPIILESPVSIECKVVEVKPLGSHDMFIAEVVNVVVEDSYLQENGQLDMAAMNLLAYNHGQYFDVTNPRGFFGWSIRKKKKLKRDIK
jgi:flavin reductase (DIM6/NTAB) family NADH-FMN oxidoreductase RutF